MKLKIKEVKKSISLLVFLGFVIISQGQTNTFPLSGNVGIGTTNPTFKLHVGGTGYYSGNLSIGTTYNGFPLNVAGNAYIIGGSIFLDDGNSFRSASASTGMYPSSSNGLSFMVAGNEYLKIGQSGNVGIGVTNPLANFHVAQSGPYNALDGTKGFMVYNPNITSANLVMGINGSASNSIQSRDGTTSTWPLAINPYGGNVGIGTTNPSAKLEVFGGKIKVNGLATSATVIDLSSVDDAVIQGGVNTQIRMGGNLNLSAGNLILFGSGGTEKMRLQSSGGLSLGNSYVGTDPGAGNMIINGNVGIGTTSPSEKLELASPNGSTVALRLTQTTKNWWEIINAGASNDLNIQDAFGNYMTIKTGGNIGIGTTSPGQKLEVNGIIAAGGIRTGGAANSDWTIGTNYGTVTKSFLSGTSMNIITSGNANEGFVVGSNGGNSLIEIQGSDGKTFISGNVGIGTNPGSEKLSVNGNVKTKKLIVTQTGWSDYVFDRDYKLKPLTEVAQFIKENKHLPEIPSAKEVEKNGISVGDNQALLLKKIEELTLYIISQDKRILQLENKIK